MKAPLTIIKFLDHKIIKLASVDTLLQKLSKPTDENETAQLYVWNIEVRITRTVKNQTINGNGQKLS